MYNPTTRLLTILELLQSRRELSGVELARRLEVDVRTVRRYITMLQDMGIPIEAGRGRYGGYQLRPGFKLPPLMFSEDEAVALTLGLLLTRHLGLGIDVAAVEGAMAKVERVMPMPVNELVKALQASLEVELPISDKPHPPEAAVIKTISLAVQRQQQLELQYQAWNGEVSLRTLDPYGLAYRAGFWYMVGYCHLRQDTRTFRLDRVLQVLLGHQTFTRPAHIDIMQHIEASIAKTPGAWRIDVLLQTTLENAQQLISPALATLEATPEGVNLRCYVQTLPWFAHFLAGLDCDMVVRHPPELRAALQALASRVMKIGNAQADASNEASNR
ncbi:MAG: YafY family protein [Chloroflexi bacterium]|nr:YafY family protein [Chloroflexota bacterium]